MGMPVFLETSDDVGHLEDANQETVIRRATVELGSV